MNYIISVYPNALPIVTFQFWIILNLLKPSSNLCSVIITLILSNLASEDFGFESIFRFETINYTNEDGTIKLFGIEKEFFEIFCKNICVLLSDKDQRKVTDGCHRNYLLEL